MDIHNAVATFNFQTAALIFISYVLVDGLYAYYTLELTKHQAAKAATSGALIYFLLAIGVLNYVQNILYLIPLAAGSWIGTFLVVKREQHHLQSSSLEKPTARKPLELSLPIE